MKKVEVWRTFVVFKIGETEIKIKARIPDRKLDKGYKNELIIDNAISDIQKNLGINLKEIVEDAYKIADVIEEPYPVLAAIERNKEGMLSAWCPFCRRWHEHGIGEGHRVAHCTGYSHFYNSGYILQKVKLPKE